MRSAIFKSLALLKSEIGKIINLDSLSFFVKEENILSTKDLSTILPLPIDELDNRLSKKKQDKRTLALFRRNK